jgi:hypothetical protein
VEPPVPLLVNGFAHYSDLSSVAILIKASGTCKMKIRQRRERPQVYKAFGKPITYP